MQEFWIDAAQLRAQINHFNKKYHQNWQLIVANEVASEEVKKFTAAPQSNSAILFNGQKFQIKKNSDRVYFAEGFSESPSLAIILKANDGYRLEVNNFHLPHEDNPSMAEAGILNELNKGVSNKKITASIVGGDFNNRYVAQPRFQRR